ncbi:MAG: pyridoxal 5'-phosphate synthase glutaminase subunit PdxT [Acidimicrobiia bacterium]|nr:pyridoxal 5'-phosphate synthase glutaminase subunit PdxT [Acidimicrobiia bacterium]
MVAVGVLALQGAFRAHRNKLAELGVVSREVRTPQDLETVDALIMPGGESTTMSMLLESSGLYEPLAVRIAAGMAVFGTCAGLILLATEIEDGRPDQRSFGRLDVSVQRNAYGRQLESFETDLQTTVTEDDIHAVFIRAPKITRVGDSIEVLASVEDEPVLVREGNALGASFHPELANGSRIHRLFLDSVAY